MYVNIKLQISFLNLPEKTQVFHIENCKKKTVNVRSCFIRQLVKFPDQKGLNRMDKELM